MKRVCTVALLAIVAALPASAVELSPGRVLENVSCRTPGHSYALYLPSAYSPQKHWPVIVCFDPGGNGVVPVRLFRDVAEARGWIVVGSNNSRNGPMQPNVEAARIVLNELNSLAIDEKRVYTAGFSGGAQVALLPAAMPECRLAGILAFSNGLPDGISAAMLHHGPVYFTAAGVQDFNYWPVMQLNDQLRDCGLISECEIFPGPHTWPPVDLLAHALDWFDVQAMRTGTLPRDNGLATQVQERLKTGIRQLEQEGRLAEALDAWERLALAWQGLGGSPEAEARSRELRNSPQLRSALKSRTAQQRHEREQLDQLMQQWARLWIASNRGMPHSQRIAVLGIRSLQRTADKKKGTADGDGAQRLMGQLLLQAQYKGYEALAAGQWDDAVLGFEIVAELRPGNPTAFYNLACANSRAGERKKALKCLQQAIDAGFRDAGLMAGDEDLKPLRGDPAFTRLLEQLRAILEKKQP